MTIAGTKETLKMGIRKDLAFRNNTTGINMKESGRIIKDMGAVSRYIGVYLKLTREDI